MPCKKVNNLPVKHKSNMLPVKIITNKLFNSDIYKR